VLIIGFRILWRTLRGGTFHCPNENTDRPYLLQEARRFFAVFFIPLIPIGKAGQAVRCESCKARFPVQVLDRPTVVDRGEQVAHAIRTAVVAMVAADPGASGDSFARLRALELVGRYRSDYGDAQLAEDLRLLPVHDVQSVMSQVAPAFDDPSKERVVTDLVAIATVNGPMSASERRVLDAFAAGIGMTPAHLRGVLAEPAG
jgi:hypothetical protein